MDHRFTYHHVGVAVQDLSESLNQYRALLGYKLIDGPFVDKIQNVTVCFVSREPSDPVLELVAPLEPGSPIDKILKRGGGVYHICYSVPNLSQAIHHLEANGSMVLSGPVPAAAFGMREIAWVMTTPGLLVELLQE